MISLRFFICGRKKLLPWISLNWVKADETWSTMELALAAVGAEPTTRMTAWKPGLDDFSSKVFEYSSMTWDIRSELGCSPFSSWLWSEVSRSSVVDIQDRGLYQLKRDFFLGFKSCAALAWTFFCQP